MNEAITKQQERIAELEEENERMANAIKWAVSVLPGLDFLSEAATVADALNRRAFPPKFEEVEVVRWECMNCGNRNFDYDARAACCANSEQVMLTGRYQRPIVAKQKNREEIEVAIGRVSFQAVKGMRYFQEWEE